MWSVSEWRIQNAICIRGTFQYKGKVFEEQYKLLANLFYIEAVELPVTSKIYSFYCFLFDKNQSIASIVEIKSNQSTPHYFRSCFQLSNCSAGISFQIWLKRSLNLDVYLQAGIGLCFFTTQYVPWRTHPTTYTVWLVDHLGVVAWNTLML